MLSYRTSDWLIKRLAAEAAVKVSPQNARDIHYDDAMFEYFAMSFVQQYGSGIHDSKRNVINVGDKIIMALGHRNTGLLVEAEVLEVTAAKVKVKKLSENGYDLDPEKHRIEQWYNYPERMLVVK